MRPLRNSTDLAVWHCSATSPEQDIGAYEIDKMHRDRGWDGIGYHIVIRRNGAIEFGEHLNNRGAHAKGFNSNSVSVCLVGGVTPAGKPVYNFTLDQIRTMWSVRDFLDKAYPNVVHLGHRDLSPDTDGDGEVEEHEWLKQCPCFNVRATFAIGSVVLDDADTRWKLEVIL